jgi:hypothetical protein
MTIKNSFLTAFIIIAVLNCLEVDAQVTVREGDGKEIPCICLRINPTDSGASVSASQSPVLPNIPNPDLFVNIKFAMRIIKNKNSKK